MAENTSRTLIERLSANIASQRKALGFTQAVLAERLGVDTETLSRFERGKHLPSLATLERLAGILRVTVAELLSEESPEPTDDALLLTSWLDGLAQTDREFAINQLKSTCSHLKQRK
jgi:transcriptional regulator with XRE-family HTH domain